MEEWITAQKPFSKYPSRTKKKIFFKYTTILENLICKIELGMLISKSELWKKGKWNVVRKHKEEI